MSAYISQIHADRAEILIDSAWTSPIGELVYIAPKFGQIGTDPGGTPLPLVIAGRGNPHAVSMWCIRLCEAARQRKTVDGVVDAFREMLAAERAAGNQLVGLPMNDQKLEQDLMLVGISETTGPFHFSISDMAGAEYGLRPLDESCWLAGHKSVDQFAGSGICWEDLAQGLNSEAGFPSIRGHARLPWRDPDRGATFTPQHRCVWRHRTGRRLLARLARPVA